MTEETKTINSNQPVYRLSRLLLSRLLDDTAHGLIALFCLAVIVFFAKSYETTLPATDASTHAALALGVTGKGLLPVLPMDQWQSEFPGKFNDHPFFFFYLSGLIQRFFGPDAWSAKLLPGLLSVGCVMLTAWLGGILRSWMTGILAGFVLLFSREFIIDGLNAHLDNGMLFFILASFIAWQKRLPIFAGVLAGIGMWMKSPIALLLFPTMFLVTAMRRRFRLYAIPLLKALCVAVLVGSGVWVLTGWLGGWELVRDYWVRQLWGTMMGGRGGAQEFSPFLFLQVLRTHYMPWSILLAWALFWAFWYRRFRENGFMVPFFGAAIVICAVSLMRFKFDHYFVPAYPFLALVAVQPLALLIRKWEKSIYRTFSVLVLLLATLLLSTPLNPAPESFPALKRFLAVIQNYGTCEDRVLFVEGGQPYGIGADYRHLIKFYTGREMLESSCAEANRMAMYHNINWILISGENFKACLDVFVMERFPSVMRYGKQYLLSKVISGDLRDMKEQDLSPFAGELKAAKDCQAIPFPKDRYN